MAAEKRKEIELSENETVCDAAKHKKANELTKAATVCKNAFPDELSKAYMNDMLMIIQPYTPQKNTIEQMRKEFRVKRFMNEAFSSFEKIVEYLCDASNQLSTEMVRSISY